MSERFTIYNDDCLKKLDILEKNSIDCIITDPPYELNFMGKGWDNAGVSFNKETWAKCLRVLKPGGYLLAFGGTRTYHRIACAIEDAGFEIRDCIMWLYGSGFPKSMNIGLAIDRKNGVESKVVGEGKSGVSSRAFQSEETTTAGGYKIKEAQNGWSGWGTALKPSYEPIIVARKPFRGSLVGNVMRYGVGGLNIDECRVSPTGEKLGRNNHVNTYGGVALHTSSTPGLDQSDKPDKGRFPANTILTYDEADFDEVCGGLPKTKSVKSARGGARNDGTTVYNKILQNIEMNYECGFNDSGSASRYFYCAKASKRDRDEGLEEFAGIELILRYNNSIWNGNLTTKGESLVAQLVDMEQSLKKAIVGFGIQEKDDTALNIMSFGRKVLEKYLMDYKSTTKTAISSTMTSQILSWLAHWNISGDIQAVSSLTENGLSPVVNVAEDGLLKITINEKMASVLGVKPVALEMQLKIRKNAKHSSHPTVKPTSLMQYLVRLVAPKGATILDPFMGSGSTGKAVVYENKERDADYKFIGIEMEEEYCKIAEARIKFAERSDK